MTAGGTAALGQPVSGALAGFLVIAAAVWTGGLVAIFVVARVAQRTLQPRERVAFFRGLGRAYGPVGSVALAVALGCGPRCCMAVPGKPPSSLRLSSRPAWSPRRRQGWRRPGG